ncbi:hypothetical protein [Lacimonas salitolerans]|uniref:Uncharacterized protein n=1 Tax=Lacimonas salitolerans TaxID=1323750 RepID=A0ABW4ECH1_9RHOB
MGVVDTCKNRGPGPFDRRRQRIHRRLHIACGSTFHDVIIVGHRRRSQRGRTQRREYQSFHRKSSITICLHALASRRECP